MSNIWRAETPHFPQTVAPSVPQLADAHVLTAEDGLVARTAARTFSLPADEVIDGVTVAAQRLAAHGVQLQRGAGSVVAELALVPQGKIIPPDTLVAGVPAKPLRELTDKDRTD